MHLSILHCARLNACTVREPLTLSIRYRLLREGNVYRLCFIESSNYVTRGGSRDRNSGEESLTGETLTATLAAGFDPQTGNCAGSRRWMGGDVWAIRRALFLLREQ